MAHNDLISRSALLELYADTDEIKFDAYNVPVPVVRQNIIDMPTIEAEPVRHGRWEEYHIRAIPSKRYKCSLCGNGAFNPDFAYGARYCPIRGAKMDKEAEN